MRLTTAATLALLGCAAPRRAPPSPPSPEVARYAPSPAWRPPSERRALYDEVTAIAGSDGVTITPDEALDRTALELCRRVARDAQNRTPGAGVIQAVAWRAGVTDPIPAVVVLRRSPGAMNDEARRGLQELVRADASTHVGAASVRVEGDEVAVLALTRRRARLDAVPRTLPLGAQMSLRGTLIGDASQPVLVVTRPDGRTVETPLGAGPSLDARLALDAPGVWQVEVTADSRAGNTVVANFPVYVDVPPPEVPDDAPSAAPATPDDTATQLLDLLNDARRRAGLRPLDPHPTLAQVARAHCDDMAAHRFVAHTSPTTGSPADRLRAAGFLTARSMENVARGYAAREIHDGLMASPGHRANILNDDVTHVGIGVTRETTANPGLLVTQVFAEVARPIDAARAAASLLDAVNARRRARGLPELSVRPELQASAVRAARTYFERPELDQQRVFEEAARSVQSPAFRRVSVAGAFGPRPEGAAEMPSLLEADLRAVGIGVAQGDRPHQPPGSVLVVFVTASPR